MSDLSKKKKSSCAPLNKSEMKVALIRNHLETSFPKEDLYTITKAAQEKGIMVPPIEWMLRVYDTLINHGILTAIKDLDRFISMSAIPKAFRNKFLSILMNIPPIREDTIA